MRNHYLSSGWLQPQRLVIPSVGEDPEQLELKQCCQEYEMTQGLKKNNLVIPSFQKRNCLFENQKEKENCHSPVFTPNAQNSWCWAKSKPGARTQSGSYGWAGSDYFSCCLRPPRVGMSRKLEAGEGLGLEPRHSLMWKTAIPSFICTTAPKACLAIS